MSAAPKPSPRFLEWDTNFFGVRIASLAAHGLREKRDFDAALEWCRRERIECLYVLSDEKDRELHALAEAAGAARVDERISLSIPIPPPSGPPDPEIRLAVEEDLPALRALASAAHTNTRFWKDPRFRRDRCAELYAIWIERSLHGKATVFVAGPPGGAHAYVTPEIGPEGAKIGLLAVAENMRRHGLGRRLMLRAYDFIHAAGHARAEYITQGPQSVALKLYQSLGSTVERVEIWHHLWFEVRP